MKWLGRLLDAYLCITEWLYVCFTGEGSCPTLPDPPDPATVPEDQWQDVVMERVSLGLKPWPSLPDNDYLNEVIGVCRVCSRNIYGGMRIGMGRWNYCYEHPDAMRSYEPFVSPEETAP